MIGRLPGCHGNGPGRRDRYIKPGPGAARRAQPPRRLPPFDTSLVSATFSRSVRSGAATSRAGRAPLSHPALPQDGAAAGFARAARRVRPVGVCKPLPPRRPRFAGVGPFLFRLVVWLPRVHGPGPPSETLGSKFRAGRFPCRPAGDERCGHACRRTTRRPSCDVASFFFSPPRLKL